MALNRALVQQFIAECMQNLDHFRTFLPPGESKLRARQSDSGVVASHPHFCYSQIGVEYSSKSNRFAVGKALPVFLAILFLGNAEPSLRAAALPETGQSHNNSGRLFAASGRLHRTGCAALYLLPALLGQCATRLPRRSPDRRCPRARLS